MLAAVKLTAGGMWHVARVPYMANSVELAKVQGQCNYYEISIFLQLQLQCGYHRRHCSPHFFYFFIRLPAPTVDVAVFSCFFARHTTLLFAILLQFIVLFAFFFLFKSSLCSSLLRYFTVSGAIKSLGQKYDLLVLWKLEWSANALKSKICAPLHGSLTVVQPMTGGCNVVKNLSLSLPASRRRNSYLNNEDLFWQSCSFGIFLSSLILFSFHDSGSWIPVLMCISGKITHFSFEILCSFVATSVCFP